MTISTLIQRWRRRSRRADCRLRRRRSISDPFSEPELPFVEAAPEVVVACSGVAPRPSRGKSAEALVEVVVDAERASFIDQAFKAIVRQLVLAVTGKNECPAHQALFEQGEPRAGEAAGLEGDAPFNHTDIERRGQRQRERELLPRVQRPMFHRPGQAFGIADEVRHQLVRRTGVELVHLADEVDHAEAGRLTAYEALPPDRPRDAAIVLDEALARRAETAQYVDQLAVHF